MLVVRFSKTPLPSLFRINQAINLHPGVQSRYVVLDPIGYARHQHQSDLVWNYDKEEIIELVEKCDLVHLHNYLGLDSDDFAPISFRKLWAAKKPIVRQFHSTPMLVARMMRTSISSVLECPIPKLVIPQYPERFFPTARVVPNIVELPTSLAQWGDSEARLRIGYAPSRFNSARSARWDTKGYPETIKMLKKVKRIGRKFGQYIDLDVIEQIPHAECMKRKALCHVAIDDLVTGSYHLSALESLAMGSATSVFMDGRSLEVLYQLTGRTDFPAINTPLEDGCEVLRELICDRDLAREIGETSHAWMNQYWEPKNMSRHFLAAYEDVIESPGKPFAERFPMGTRAGNWRAVGYYDVLWKNRQSRWPRIMPNWLIRIKSVIGNLLRRIHLRR